MDPEWIGPIYPQYSPAEAAARSLRAPVESLYTNYHRVSSKVILGSFLWGSESKLSSLNTHLELCCVRCPRDWWILFAEGEPWSTCWDAQGEEIVCY